MTAARDAIVGPATRGSLMVCTRCATGPRPHRRTDAHDARSFRRDLRSSPNGAPEVATGSETHIDRSTH
eukprot:3748412-Prymnesium_polylepis.1